MFLKHKTILILILTALYTAATVKGEPSSPQENLPSEDTTKLIHQIGYLYPLSKFVSVAPVLGSITQIKTKTISIDDARNLHIVFLRDSLPVDCGPQFIKITTTIADENKKLIDKSIQYAVTGPKNFSDTNDLKMFIKYIHSIYQYAIINPEIFETIYLNIDSLSGWESIKIEVESDDDFIKYAGKQKNKCVWYYKVKGSRYNVKFFLGAPKVLYDTRSSDSVQYGTTSVIVRLVYLDDETGEPFPVNIGIGTFGVNTPIDISKDGGGFVFSLFLDIIQISRIQGYYSQKINAGLEITPFFPIQKKSRVLVNVRIGYSP